MTMTYGAAAIVTGAGSGIGRSFVLELARRKGTILCVDNNPETAAAVAKEADALRGRGIAYTCDVGNEKQFFEMAGQVDALLGRPPTVIVNNAGVGVGGRMGNVSLADWHWCMSVNLWGVIHGCHEYARRFREIGYGGIINTSSAAGFAAAPEMTTYNVSKAGVLSLSETLAAELTGTGVHVTVVCPTFVPTNIIANSHLPDASRAFATTAMAKFAFTTSDSVARLALNALDKNQLYVFPQWDGQLLWRAKRAFPALYTRLLGEIYRLVDR